MTNTADAGRTFQLQIFWSKDISTGDIPRLVPEGSPASTETVDFQGLWDRLGELNVPTHWWHKGFDAEGRAKIPGGLYVISLARIVTWVEL